MHKIAQILTIFAWAAFFAGCRNAPDETVQTAMSEPAGALAEARPKDNARHILIFGDSITAGYGLAEEDAFPALVQQKIDDLGWSFRVINGGLSGDTSAGGLRRIAWMLRDPVDVFVLELGGNDGLRGTSPEVTKDNLQNIVDTVREKSPEAHIVIAGMQIPPNLGLQHTERFREIFGELARENEASLIPFLLEGVGGVPRLNQPDGIHPTAEGHAILSETVWSTLEPILRGIVEADPTCGDPSAGLVAEDCGADAAIF